MAQLGTKIENRSEYLIDSDAFRWTLTALITMGLLLLTLQAMNTGIIRENPRSRNDITGIPSLEFHPERILDLIKIF